VKVRHPYLFFTQFKQLVQLSTASNHGEAALLLSKLKLCLVEFPSLPPSTSISSSVADEKLAACQLMELATYFSVKVQDGSFESNYTFLNSLYEAL
jgi:hypothetical protein